MSSTLYERMAHLLHSLLLCFCMGGTKKELSHFFTDICSLPSLLLSLCLSPSLSLALSERFRCPMFKAGLLLWQLIGCSGSVSSVTSNQGKRSDSLYWYFNVKRGVEEWVILYYNILSITSALLQQ